MSQAGIRRGRPWIAIGGVLYAYLTAFSASGEEASLVLQRAVALAAEGRTAEAERAYRQVLEDKTSAAAARSPFAMRSSTSAVRRFTTAG